MITKYRTETHSDWRMQSCNKLSDWRMQDCAPVQVQSWGENEAEIKFWWVRACSDRPNTYPMDGGMTGYWGWTAPGPAPSNTGCLASYLSWSYRLARCHLVIQLITSTCTQLSITLYIKISHFVIHTPSYSMTLMALAHDNHCNSDITIMTFKNQMPLCIIINNIIWNSPNIKYPIGGGHLTQNREHRNYIFLHFVHVHI
jgi:hypothetical protein